MAGLCPLHPGAQGMASLAHLHPPSPSSSSPDGPHLSLGFWRTDFIPEKRRETGREQRSACWGWEIEVHRALLPLALR